MESNAGTDPKPEVTVDSEDEDDEIAEGDAADDDDAVTDDDDDSDEESEDEEDDDEAEDEAPKARSLAEIHNDISAKGLASVTAEELVRYQRYVTDQSKRITNHNEAAKAARELRPDTEAKLLAAINEVLPITDKTKGDLLRHKLAESIGPAFDNIEAAVHTVVLDDLQTSLLGRHVPDNTQNRAVLASAETWDDVIDLAVGAGEGKSAAEIKRLKDEVEELKEAVKTQKNRVKAAGGKEKGSPKTRGAPAKAGASAEAFMSANRAEQVKMMRSNKQEIMGLTLK